MSVRKRWMLLTFGAGLPNWRAAARRLARQASEVGWFDDVVIITDKDLKREFPGFYDQHRKILRLGTRGFGYWIWKPYLIQQMLAKYGSRIEGLVYLDAGFELNSRTLRARERFAEYQNMALDSSGLFAMDLPGHFEYEWSRRLTIERLGLPQSAVASPQIQATPFFVANDFSKQFVDQWLAIVSESDYLYATDGPLGEVNLPGFRAHRHDQSIFSGLAKNAGVRTISDETFWAPDWAERGANYPLWAARNRTRFTMDDRRALARATRTGERAYSRLLRNFATSRVRS